MIFSILTLPTNFTTDVKTIISDLFTDLSPIIVLVVGVFLGLIALEVFIGAFRK